MIVFLQLSRDQIQKKKQYYHRYFIRCNIFICKNHFSAFNKKLKNIKFLKRLFVCLVVFSVFATANDRKWQTAIYTSCDFYKYNIFHLLNSQVSFQTVLNVYFCFVLGKAFPDMITIVNTESWQNRRLDTTPLDQRWLYLVFSNFCHLYSSKKSMGVFKRKKIKNIYTGKNPKATYIRFSLWNG